MIFFFFKGLDLDTFPTAFLRLSTAVPNENHENI